MKYFGDITKLSGYKLPVVDVITGGSPCQDLSVAGKRAGLAGERSGLFMEQIRIVRELRERDKADGRTDELIRPRYMVWENVPGAFSSNKGEDFRAVLEETAKIAEQTAVIPRPPKGKWTNAGCVMGDGWSIAWRVHDAQFWGVPQRRKRIALVADFGGFTAPEILFERESVSRDIAQGGKEGQGTAAGVGTGIEETGGAIVYGFSGYYSNAMKSPNPHSGIYEAETARTLDLNGGSPVCNQGGMAVVQGADMYNGSLTGDIAATLNAASGNSPTHSGSSVVCLEGNGSRPSHRGDGYSVSETMYTLNSTEHHAVAVENHPADSRVKISEDGMVQTLSGRMETGGGNVPMVMEQGFAMQAIGEYKQSEAASSLKMRDYKDATDLVVGSFYPQMKAESQCWCDDDVSNTLVNGTSPGYQNGIVTAVDCRNGTENESINGTLQAKSNGGISVNLQNVVRLGAVVRRLTPLECERLQGYPDGWTDIGEWVDSKGKKHKGESDSPRYKALGNSIALPFWEWMAQRIVKYLGEKPTMASLFDGIGGFPLVFERCGAKAVWASEIEEFPIAVTKRNFPQDEST